VVGVGERAEPGDRGFCGFGGGGLVGIAELETLVEGDEELWVASRGGGRVRGGRLAVGSGGWEELGLDLEIGIVGLVEGGLRLRILVGPPGSEPVQPTAGGQQGEVGRLGFAGGPAFFQGFAGGGAAEDESIAGAGASHVEQAQFLDEGFAALSAAGEPMRQAGITLAGFPWLHPGAEAVVGIEDDLGMEVFEIEAFGQVGDDHDGEFQTFALVNAKQAHGIESAGCHGIRFSGEVGLGLDEAEEAGEALALEGVESY